MRGRSSNPSMSRPISSLVENWAGPSRDRWPAARAQPSAAFNRATAASAASRTSKKPSQPAFVSCKRLLRAVGEAAVLEEGILRGIEEGMPFREQRRHPVRIAAVNLPGKLDNGASASLVLDGQDGQIRHGLLRRGHRDYTAPGGTSPAAQHPGGKTRSP